jgi:predicted MFS family arabinose efflux permease
MQNPSLAPAVRSSRRWAVLAAYAVVAGVSQMLWLNFAPLLSLVEHRYGVSELAASLLVLVFPLLYVVFSVPAGALIDARGYRFGVGLGVVTMTVFACVRIFEASFWPLLVGQVGIAVAQPYVVNGVSKLVADWFDEAEGALATGLATMGMFVGMAAGMAATPAIVSAGGLRFAMVVFAAITAASTIVFFAFVHANAERRGPASSAEDAPSTSGFRLLLRDPQIRLLVVLSFLGLGVFNGLTTWLEPIVTARGIDSEQAGLAGGAILLGGIVGAVVIPAASDALQRRKPFLLVCVAGALATIYPLCTTGSFRVLLALGALHGFFFLPAFALLLDACAKIAGARSAGATTSLVMLAGNAGGVVVVLAMERVKGDGHDFQPAILLLVALLATTLLLGLRVREPLASRTSP